MRHAVAAWRDRGTTFDAVQAPAEQLPSLLPLMQIAREELASRGFLLLREIPMQEFTDEEAATLYWAIGSGELPLCSIVSAVVTTHCFWPLGYDPVSS